MEPDARYTLIGSIVVVLVGALALALLWLTGAGGSSEFRYYTIYFERQSLEGLQIGGDVNMRGIKVGRVEQFGIARENINRVSVLVRVDKQTPVSTNSEAVVSRNLVTSIAKIDLQTPGTPGPQLKEVLPKEQYPVIAEGRGSLDFITESANSLVVDAGDALKKINQVMSEQNLASLRTILTNVSDVTTKLDARLNAVELAATSIQRTSGAFEQAAGDITKSLAGLSGQIGPLSTDARNALRAMRTALSDISQAAQGMQTSTDSLARQAGDAADVGITEMRATASDLRRGVELLSRTLEKLQDPRAAILGPGESQLGPGEVLR